MDRSASFSREQEYRALEQIEKDGGVTPLGKLRESVHTDPRHGRAIANAMLVRRTVGLSLRRPLTLDTPVRRPARLPVGVRPLRNIKICLDGKGVVEGQSVSVRVDLGGSGSIKKEEHTSRKAGGSTNHTSRF